MILLTKIDEKKIAVNEDLIETITEAPDTIITMHNGKSYAVCETIDLIIEKVVEFKKQCIVK